MMSVILFSKNDVFQELANAYEGLKSLVYPSETVDDQRFYKSLRRLHFANVAAFLCQYHDDTPLPDGELVSIDTFTALHGVADPSAVDVENLNRFLSAWGSLKYNLVTNDGEEYRAVAAEAYIEGLIEQWSLSVIETPCL